MFLAVIPSSLVHPARSEIMQPAMMWQGFHFQWLRRELGFETPHRLGSFASYIHNVSGICSTPRRRGRTCSALGTYQVQFSPGVSGDYAYPVVFYQAVASTNSSEIDISVGNTTFSFRDNSTADPVPHADTSRHVNITIPVSDHPLSFSQDQLLLRGFQVGMKCIATSAHPCNSNAIWPYYFNLSVAQNCTLLAKQKVNYIWHLTQSLFAPLSLLYYCIRLWCVLCILVWAEAGRRLMVVERATTIRWSTTSLSTIPE